jgi:hypothetical protein
VLIVPLASQMHTVKTQSALSNESRQAKEDVTVERLRSQHHCDTVVRVLFRPGNWLAARSVHWEVYRWH